MTTRVKIENQGPEMAAVWSYNKDRTIQSAQAMVERELDAIVRAATATKESP